MWKKQYGTRAEVHPYSNGDFVYLLNTTVFKGPGKKLRSLYRGPFLVLEVISPSVLRIADRKKEMIVGHDRLRPCHDRDMPLWIRRQRNRLFNAPRVVDKSAAGPPTAEAEGASAPPPATVTTGTQTSMPPRMQVKKGNTPEQRLPDPAEGTVPMSKYGRVLKRPSRFT